MVTIISIEKTNSSFHPAFGWSYKVKLSDNSSVFPTDDELLGRFKEYRVRGTKPETLIGKEWKA